MGVVGTILAYVLNLTMLTWLLRNSIPALNVVIPILFQPELRRALEQIGRAGGLLPHSTALTATVHERARLPSALDQCIRNLCKDAFRSLGLSGYARIDLRREWRPVSRLRRRRKP